MSAHKLYLAPSLWQAVLQGALTLKEAWLLQDEMLQQWTEEVAFPQEYRPLLEKWQFSQWEKPEHQLLP